MIEFLTGLLITASIFGIVATSLNLMIGYTGIFSIAHGIFFGVGAYTTSLLALHLTSSILVALVVSMVVAAAASVLLALPAAKVTGEYFVIASMAFGVIGISIFSQWTSVTGGAAGLVGIPRATLFGVPLATNNSYLVLSVVCLIAVVATVGFVAHRTPLGRSFQALRDDPLAARALGESPFRLRLISSMLAGALASVGGVIYAGYVSFVNADSFGESSSVLFMAMVVLGGAGSVYGPVVGAFFITFFPQVLGFLDMPANLEGPMEQAIYGLALILLMIIRPEGLASIVKADIFRRGFAKTLSSRRADMPLTSQVEPSDMWS